MTPPLFAFVHCEKTAGSTLSLILRRHYGPDQYVSVGTRKDRRGALEAMRAVSAAPGPVRGVRGHIPFGVMRRHLPPDTRYFTLLREPLERAVSHFFYLRAGRDRALAAAHPQARKLTPRHDETLAEALARPRVLVDNLQTRMTCADPAAWRRWREPVGRQTLEDAKQSLRERFEVFGIVERFDDSLARILAALELPPAGAYERAKVGSHPAVDELDESDVQALREHNLLDLELYEYASELFDSRQPVSSPT